MNLAKNSVESYSAQMASEIWIPENQSLMTATPEVKAEEEE